MSDNNKNNIEEKTNESNNEIKTENKESQNVLIKDTENKEKQIKPVKKYSGKILEQLNGVFCVDKPIGLSSSDVVTILKHKVTQQLIASNLIDKRKKKRNMIKIGHGGTLDPLASGCLVIGLFKGTKMLNTLLSGSKVYEAVGRFGSSTETYDCLGELVEEKPYQHITKEKLEETLKEFVGEIEQYPPIYSALKVNGKPMYEYAKSGQEIPKEIKSRKITIHSIELLEYNNEPTKTMEIEVDNDNEDFVFQKDTDDDSNSIDKSKAKQNNNNGNNDKKRFQFKNKAVANTKLPEGPIFRFRVECGGGTYIRSLIHDIGKKLDSAAHMVSLIRSKQGPFKVEEAISIKDCDDLINIKNSMKHV
ncbi:pseudouridine synthase [Anaeromyces robustus]|uniref:tRNA pseudouridine(55) synthase n=1 Tax=Anaeromyces robustus TaxID=1754192 RepID=A0A1Y1XI33_9FUNG|nr:pseudouridine synthase [Anaeromyces robustus]|eukprot:ORX85407.1 pseudouridine synthase [Anaeromyces robustus]